MDLQSYLDRFNVRYQVSEHPAAYTAQGLAQAEHVSGRRVIKPVLVECDGQMVLCALPACDRVDLEALREDLDAERVNIADESLLAQNRVTFQAGTHHEAVTMSMDDYRRLAQPGIGRFAIHA